MALKLLEIKNGISYFTALSTDQKPIAGEVEINSELWETDTKIRYKFNGLDWYIKEKISGALEEVSLSSVEAGFVTAENVVLTSDFTITINGGYAKGLWVGTAGDISIVTPKGDSITYKNVPVGMWAMPCTSIKSTANGTAAADIVAGAW